MSVKDKTSLQSGRLLFMQHDHVAGYFKPESGNPRYIQGLYMKGKDPKRKDFLWQKKFPDRFFIRPCNGSTIDWAYNTAKIYTDAKCFCGDMDAILPYESLPSGHRIIHYEGENIYLSNKCIITTHSDGYAHGSASSFKILLDDGHSSVDYIPKMQYQTGWISPDFYFPGTPYPTKGGFFYVQTEQKTVINHWGYIKLNDKRHMNFLDDEIILSDKELGTSLNTYIREGTTYTYQNIYTSKDAPEILFSTSIRFGDYYTDDNHYKLFFVRMAPSGSKKTLGFLQYAGSDRNTHMSCRGISIQDVQYLNGRWVIAAITSKNRNPASSKSTTGTYVSIYTLTGSSELVAEHHIPSYSNNGRVKIIYTKGIYYVYIAAQQNVNGQNFIYSRILRGSALSNLSEIRMTGSISIPHINYLGEESGLTYHVLFDGDPGDKPSDTDNDRYLYWWDTLPSEYTYAQFENAERTEPTRLITNGPWTRGWYNHGGNIIFDSMVPRQSSENWCFHESDCAWNARQNDIIWKLYYESEEV